MKLSAGRLSAATTLDPPSPAAHRALVRGSHLVGKRNLSYWEKGKPYLDGSRAIFISDTAPRVAALRGERVHIAFRGLAPKQRDELVKALGAKITLQESPWDCALL